MKMISSTSITSTSGTTLISDSDVVTRRPRLPRAGGARRSAAFPLREIPFGDVQKFHREIVHLPNAKFFTRCDK
mgnify:CR=1 FL=1